MSRLLSALCLLALLAAAQADRGWRFDVNSKAEAARMATEHGVGFDNDGNEQPETLRAMFVDWCQTYNLASPSDQGAFRNFVANMKEVRRINLDDSLSFWAAGNAYSHLSSDQFLRQFAGAKAPTGARRSELEVASEATQAVAEEVVNEAGAVANRKLLAPRNAKSPKPSPLPSPSPSPLPSPAPGTTVNWVTRGMVTPIRNQGQCGSCWAFAATAAVESAYLMAGYGSASTLDLSEQQLVSCEGNSGGCNGGYLNYAIDYFARTPVVKETLWPYTTSTGTCNTANMASATSGNAVQTTSGSVMVAQNNETALKAAVLAAPTGFLMMVDTSFQSYRGGVYSSTTCTTQVNHAMLLVGIDRDATTGQWYWLVKNSWGSGWGESGYIRVKMTGVNGTGMCGMYQWAFKAPTAFSSVPLI